MIMSVDDPIGVAPLTWAKAGVINKGGSSGGAPRVGVGEGAPYITGGGPKATAAGVPLSRSSRERGWGEGLRATKTLIRPSATFSRKGGRRVCAGLLPAAPRRGKSAACCT